MGGYDARLRIATDGWMGGYYDRLRIATSGWTDEWDRWFF